MSDRETRIRERAHQLWEREGRPSGRELDHWEQASREIDAEDSAVATKAKAPRATRSTPSAGSVGGVKPAGKKRTGK